MVDVDGSDSTMVVSIPVLLDEHSLFRGIKSALTVWSMGWVTHRILSWIENSIRNLKLK
jgi:hypothetical protein